MRLTKCLAAIMMTAPLATACSSPGLHRLMPPASSATTERPNYAGVMLPDGAEVDESRSLVFGHETGWSGRIVLTASLPRAASEVQIENILTQAGRRPVSRSIAGETIIVFLDPSGTGVTHVRIWDRFGGVGMEIVSQLPRTPSAMVAEGR